jgi:hypothetical protein
MDERLWNVKEIYELKMCIMAIVDKILWRFMISSFKGAGENDMVQLNTPRGATFAISIF